MSIRTTKQLMANEDSGVPLVSNAANLDNFFSKRGFGDTWSDERGGVEITNGSSGIMWQTSGNQVWVDLAKGLSGTWAGIPADKDALIILSGHRSVDDAEWNGENPTLTFRMGSNEAGKGTIRVRAPSAGQNFGDQIQDDLGTQVDISSTPALPERDPPNTGEHFILVGALQRGTTDYWHTVTWKVDGYYQNDATDITSLNVGAITPFSHDNEYIAGKFYGIGRWTFDTLPDDFREAALSMGMAWSNGNYTFWDDWGKE